MKLFTELAKASMRNQSGISRQFVPKRTIFSDSDYTGPFKYNFDLFMYRHSGKMAVAFAFVSITGLLAISEEIRVEKIQLESHRWDKLINEVSRIADEVSKLNPASEEKRSSDSETSDMSSGMSPGPK